MVVQGQVTSTLVLGSMMTVLEGLGYLVVGSMLGQKAVAADARWAARLFRAWWYLIGTNKLLAAFSGLAIAYGAINEPFYISIIYLNVVILCLSLWALLTYLSYLLSGRRFWVGFVAALYLSYYLLLTYHIAAGHPTGVLLGAWRTALLSEFPPPPVRGLAVLLLLVVPPLVAALAYLTLVFRIHDRTSRYRVGLLSASIIGWTLSIFFVSVPAFSTSAALQVASRGLGVLSALLSLLAYRPPEWLQRGLGVQGLPMPLRRPSTPRSNP